MIVREGSDSFIPFQGGRPYIHEMESSGMRRGYLRYHNRKNVSIKC